MANFNEIVDKLTQDYESAAQSGTGDAYSKLSSILGELDHYVREYIQELTEEDVKAVIKKLKAGEAISPQELEQIKLWMVGDAESYTRIENNYKDWQAELKRLMGEIQKIKAEETDLPSACKLRALFIDAARTVSNIMYFLQQKERLERFTESTREIDPEEGAILVKLLEQKLWSANF